MWDSAKVNHSDLLKDLLDNNYTNFQNWDRALRSIQDYIDVRQKYLMSITSKDVLTDPNLQRLVLLNQNIISEMEKNKSILNKVENYWQVFEKNNVYSEIGSQELIQNENASGVTITGDSIVLSGSAIRDRSAFATGETVSTVGYQLIPELISDFPSNKLETLDSRELSK